MLPADADSILMISLILKSSLVLGLAWLVVLGLRHSGGSAAARHLVWVAALGTVLALPGLIMITPQWWPSSLELRARSDTVRGAEEAFSKAPEGLANLDRGEPVASIPDRQNVSAPWPSVDQITLPSFRDLGLGIYLIVAGLLLGRIFMGRWTVRRVSRNATRVSGDPWTRPLREEVARAGIGREVSLLMSSAAAIPMTWGTRRPTILLPTFADGWPEERRRMVLMHELSHVRRLDCLTQTMAAVACSVYWFHPGVWYAARRLRVERELACDDHVLVAGARPSAYAAVLLETSRAFRPAVVGSPVAIGMAHSSQLEERMRAILDAMRPRKGISRRVLTIGCLLSLGLLLPLAVVHPVIADPGPVVSTEVYGVDTSLAAPGGVVERSILARPGALLTIDLQTGGQLELMGWDQDSIYVRAENRASDDGEVRIDLVAVAGGTQLIASVEGAESADPFLYQIFVPAHHDLDIRSAGGGISIADVEGSIEGATAGGTVLLERVRGTVQLMAGRGQFEVRESVLEGSLRTEKGIVWQGKFSGNYRNKPWTDQ